MVRPMTQPAGAASGLFTEVKRTRSSDDVVTQIRDAIIAGRLKTGDRLPNERELCRVFGVGRSTLREGLRTLEALGVIDIRPGAAGGIFTSEPQADHLGSALEALLRFRHATVQELAECQPRRPGADDRDLRAPAHQASMISWATANARLAAGTPA